jgi:hypothetical protein
MCCKPLALSAAPICWPAPPGSDTDPSPGARPDEIHLILPELTSLLDQTHEECDDLDADEKNQCASNYLLDLMGAWQENDFDNDDQANIYFGLYSSQAGWGRGQGYWGVATTSGGSCCGSGSWDFDGLVCRLVHRHEMGHSWAATIRFQAQICGHSDDDGDFPTPTPPSARICRGLTTAVGLRLWRCLLAAARPLDNIT